MRQIDFQSEPINFVWEYVVRTGCSEKIFNCRKKEIEQAKKEDQVLDNKEQLAQLAAQKIQEWKMNGNNNIFHFTKFDSTYAYQHFHPSVQQICDQEEEFDCYPELYQVVMVASELLRSIYSEECLKTVLARLMKPSIKIFIETFGSVDLAIEKVPFLEGPHAVLPMVRVKASEFRRSISTALVGIASFFAYAIYDEMSFYLALVMLMGEHMLSGQPIPDTSFLQHENLEDNRLGINNSVWLFDSQTLDEGEVFMENVVEVMNCFSKVLIDKKKDLKREESERTKKPQKQEVETKRIAQHFYRTLTSDFVEIYVSHGLRPRITAECKEDHQA
jgi:hypothetical protein